MGKLEGIDTDRLEAAVAEATSAKGAKRLMMALAYGTALTSACSPPDTAPLCRPSTTGSTASKSRGSRRPWRMSTVPVVRRSSRPSNAPKWSPVGESTRAWSGMDGHDYSSSGSPRGFEVEYATAHLHRRFLSRPPGITTYIIVLSAETDKQSSI